MVGGWGATCGIRFNSSVAIAGQERLDCLISEFLQRSDKTWSHLILSGFYLSYFPLLSCNSCGGVYVASKFVSASHFLNAGLSLNCLYNSL